MAAAERVSPGAASGTWSRKQTAPATEGMPAMTMRESHTTGIPAASAASAASTACSPIRAVAANDSSAVECTMRATTSRAPGGQADRSTRSARIR